MLHSSICPATGRPVTSSSMQAAAEANTPLQLFVGSGVTTYTMRSASTPAPARVVVHTSGAAAHVLYSARWSVDTTASKQVCCAYRAHVFVVFHDAEHQGLRRRFSLSGRLNYMHPLEFTRSYVWCCCRYWLSYSLYCSDGISTKEAEHHKYTFHTLESYQ